MNTHPGRTNESEPIGGTAPRWRALRRSSVVGLVATVADLVVLVAAIDGLRWSKSAANVPALAIGLIVQFFGNKYYAFEDKSSSSLARQGTLFALVEVGTFLLNAAAFHLLAVTGGAHHLLARVAGTGVVYFAFSYPLWALIFQSPALTKLPEPLTRCGEGHLEGRAP